MGCYPKKVSYKSFTFYDTKHLEDVVLVGHQICDHEAELRGGEEVRHLVVVGVPRQPRLDDELVRALAARHEPVPRHLHARQRHLQTRV